MNGRTDGWNRMAEEESSGREPSRDHQTGRAPEVEFAGSSR